MTAKERAAANAQIRRSHVAARKSIRIAVNVAQQEGMPAVDVPLNSLMTKMTFSKKRYSERVLKYRKSVTDNHCQH